MNDDGAEGCFPPVKRKIITHPLSMGSRATGILASLAVFTAAGRGIDYVLPGEADSSSLGIIENAAPLPVWGSLFLIGVALVAFGQISEHWRVLLAGHVVIAGMYATIGLGQLGYTLPTYGFDGFRTGWGLTVGGSGIHILFACVVWSHYKRRRAPSHATGA